MPYPNRNPLSGGISGRHMGGHSWDSEEQENGPTAGQAAKEPQPALASTGACAVPEARDAPGGYRVSGPAILALSGRRNHVSWNEWEASLGIRAFSLPMQTESIDDRRILPPGRPLETADGLILPP